MKIIPTPESICWKFKYYGEREFWSIMDIIPNQGRDSAKELHGFSSEAQAQEVADYLLGKKIYKAPTIKQWDPAKKVNIFSD